MNKSAIAALITLGLLPVPQSARAGSATWSADQANYDWNTAANWTPETVPNGPDDIATFYRSGTMSPIISSPVELWGLTFKRGASTFYIYVTPEGPLTIDGPITNDSVSEHRIYVQGATTTGGVLTISAATLPALLYLQAGQGAEIGAGAQIVFKNQSSAGNAVVTAEGYSMGRRGTSGVISFVDSASAGNATLYGGYTVSGGLIRFLDDSTGGTAQVSALSQLDISGHNMGIGLRAVTGYPNGIILLGGNYLQIGEGSAATEADEFIGRIRDGGEFGGTGGQLRKVGLGTLTLSGANSYTGGTIVSGGILLVNNTSGSGTGTGQVQAEAGTLGGSGTITGAVIVGTGTGAGAILGPGARGVTPGTLTINAKLTLRADATYRVTLDSRVSIADSVSAKGIRIQGASILFNDLATDVLPAGTSFVIISNTAASPTSSHFTNLADGATVIVGNNTFQANYEGGDGNDLTLTVIQ